VLPPRQPLTTATQTTPKPAAPSPSSPAPQAYPEAAAAAAADATPSAPTDGPVDWSRSFHGLSSTAFDPAARAILLAPVNEADVEIKPDGIVYLPEIKYRRILNRAFGPGAWGLAPRGELEVSARTVSREYGLVVQGR
jgi:Mitochondrial genome maintenance MGM101